MQVLILGGTGEARELAKSLMSLPGITFISSLAGRVSRPALPVGDVRIGGFGGASGLADWLRTERIDALVDATHPFAAQITRNAAQACADVGVPLLVLRRPGWEQRPDDQWTRVPDIYAAASVVAGHPAPTVFLTTGRRDLAAFAPDSSHDFLVRAVDPPDDARPVHCTIVLDRGPYTIEGERRLMTEHGVGLLVTKDSGGTMTIAKLTAARDLGIPVIVVDRPTLPDGVAQVSSVDDAAAWVLRFRDSAAV